MLMAPTPDSPAAASSSSSDRQEMDASVVQRLRPRRSRSRSPPRRRTERSRSPSRKIALSPLRRNSRSEFDEPSEEIEDVVDIVQVIRSAFADPKTAVEALPNAERARSMAAERKKASEEELAKKIARWNDLVTLRIARWISAAIEAGEQELGFIVSLPYPEERGFMKLFNEDLARKGFQWIVGFKPAGEDKKSMPKMHGIIQWKDEALSGCIPFQLRNTVCNTAQEIEVLSGLMVPLRKIYED